METRNYYTDAQIDGSDNNDVIKKGIELSKERIAAYTAQRSTAAEANHEKDYKEAAESLKWWSDHLLELQAKQDHTTETGANILKLAGRPYTNGH